MNTELNELERELKALVPRSLPGHVQDRIAAELNTVRFPAARTTVWLRAAAAIFAVAAVSAALWAVRDRLGPAGPQVAQEERAAVAAPPVAVDAAPALAEEVFEPLVVKTVVVGQRDQGVIAGSHARPVRRVQYDMVDRMEWGTPSGRGRYIVTRPRSEVVLVSMEAF